MISDRRHGVLRRVEILKLSHDLDQGKKKRLPIFHARRSIMCGALDFVKKIEVRAMFDDWIGE